MRRKINLVMFLFVVFLLVNTVTTTYAKYVAASTGDITTQFARWQISINDANITQSYNTSVSYTPTIDSSTNVKNGKIAPGSTGYFDIEIDPTKVDLSYTYTINITQNTNTDVKDVKITHYAIYDPSVSNPTMTKVASNGTNITQTYTFDNSTANFSFKVFAIRIYFQWDDSSSGTMNDDQDTAVAYKAANNTTVNNGYTVSVAFTQYNG